MEDKLNVEKIRRSSGKLGREVIVLEETISTNDVVREMGKAGAAHGLVVAAEHQTGGRGRLGRSWVSPPGRNLLFSVLLRPGELLKSPGLITITAGIGVALAVRERIIKADLKWPNDVRVKGKKLAGILAEAEGGDFVILGIGINVNLAADEMPDEIREIATSVMIEAGHPAPRNDLLNKVLGRLDLQLTLLEGGRSDRILGSFREMSEACGRRVVAVTPEGEVRGTALGVRADGALLIKTDEGPEAAVIAGDVRVEG